jgi:O-antigen/teichoic acid export membrane protein
VNQPEAPAADRDTSHLRAAARGGAANLIGVAITSTLNLAVVIVVTHELAKTAAGAVFAITSFFFLVETVVRLGTDGGVVNFVAKYRVIRTADVSKAITASFLPLLPAMAVGAVAVGVGVPVIVHAVDAGSSVSRLGLISAAVAIAVPLAATYDFLAAVTRGLGSSRPTVMIERILRPILLTAGVAAAAFGGGGAAWVALAWVAPYLVALPLMANASRRLLASSGVAAWSPEWRSEFGEVWRFTLPRSFTGILQILLQRLDIIIVGAILGAPAAAVYTGATRFVVVGQLGNQAISYVFQPQLAGLLGAGKIEQARELYRVSTAWIVGLNAPLYLTVCTASPLLVRLLGSHYRAGLSSMVVVTAISLVGSACGLVDFVLITMGRTSWNLANTTAALAVNLAIDLIFIRHHGIIAAAIGWGAAILINNLVPLYQIHRYFDFTPFSRLWLEMLGITGVLFGIVPGVVLITVGASLPIMVAALAAAFAVYLAALWSRRERLAIAQLLPVRRK